MSAFQFARVFSELAGVPQGLANYMPAGNDSNESSSSERLRRSVMAKTRNTVEIHEFYIIDRSAARCAPCASSARRATRSWPHPTGCLSGAHPRVEGGMIHYKERETFGS